MEGAKIILTAYKTLLEQQEANQVDQESIEDTKKNIKCYEILSGIDRDMLFKMFDSSFFNDIMKAYVDAAIKEEAEEVKSRIRSELEEALGSMTAEQAIEQWKGGKLN